MENNSNSLQELNFIEIESINGGESIGYWIGYGVGWAAGSICNGMDYVLDSFASTSSSVK